MIFDASLCLFQMDTSLFNVMKQYGGSTNSEGSMYLLEATLNLGNFNHIVIIFKTLIFLRSANRVLLVVSELFLGRNYLLNLVYASICKNKAGIHICLDDLIFFAMA